MGSSGSAGSRVTVGLMQHDPPDRNVTPAAIWGNPCYRASTRLTGLQP